MKRRTIKEIDAELTPLRARWKELIDMRAKFKEEWEDAERFAGQARDGILEITQRISKLQRERERCKKLKRGSSVK